MLHPDVLAALTEESHVPNPKLEQKATPFVLSTSENFHPINLSRLRAKDFVAYLLSMAPINHYKSKSTYGGARAALFDLFRE